MSNEAADPTPERKHPEPASESEKAGDSERSRFARLAKKLVSVPKKEIDEKAKEWDRERGRERERRSES